jgi:hypothetical protein
MIEVNLLPGGKKRTARGKRRTITLPKLGALPKDRWVAGAVLALIGSAGFSGWMYFNVAGRGEELATRSRWPAPRRCSRPATRS